MVRNSHVDIAARPSVHGTGVPTTMRIARDERWTKLVAALAFSLVVGVGTYTATYRALVLISTPATASIAPAKSESPAPVQVPTTSTPAATP
jgi:hypothetical protein